MLKGYQWIHLLSSLLPFQFILPRLCLFIGIVLPCYRETVSTHRESLAGDALTLHPRLLSVQKDSKLSLSESILPVTWKMQIDPAWLMCLPLNPSLWQRKWSAWLVCLSHMPTAEAKGHTGHFEWQFYVEIRVLGWRNNRCTWYSSKKTKSSKLRSFLLFCRVKKNISRSAVSVCNPIIGHSPPGSPVHGIPPGKNTGVGGHSLL